MISAEGWGKESRFTGSMTAGHLDNVVIAVRPET